MSLKTKSGAEREESTGNPQRGWEGRCRPIGVPEDVWFLGAALRMQGS